MWGGSTLIASQIDEAHVSLCVDQGAADVVTILRVMKGIYAPTPFQLGRPSRVVYGASGGERSTTRDLIGPHRSY